MKKIELLAPAGDLEKLKTAVDFGADAVYFGGRNFGLRSAAGNLDIPEIKEGLDYLHERGKRGYLTLNIFAHNEDLEPMVKFLEELKETAVPDAFLVTDPGVMSVLLSVIPDAEVHISTQASTTNVAAAEFWHRLGVKRIVLARELSLREIREIVERAPEGMEFEAFVHGAMCISYSGRCLLSNFLIQRDANRGECAQPCRWKYALTEEQRPGEYFPIEEDERGAYILNSKDLCMIGHIPELIESGLCSLKIEGRMKSAFYVASVVHAYRLAIDSYYSDPEHYELKDEWLDELLKVSHRHFTTGFYFDKPTSESQNYLSSQYVRDYDYTGNILDYDEKTGLATVEQRSKMVVGDEIEIFGPFADFFVQKIEEMYDPDGTPIDSCPHPKQIIKIRTVRPVKPGWIMRRQK
jgi:putative protease